MKNKKNSEWTAGRFGCPFLVLAAGSLWGLMELLVRSLNEAGLSSMEICFIRAVITFVCMLAGLFLAFVGCSFVSGIVGGAGALSFQGILYGFGAGFGYALYSIFGRYALERNYSSVTISFYTFLFAAVSSVFFVDGGKVLSTVGSSLQLGGKTVFLVLLVTLLPYLSYTRGLKGMENGTASVLASIEPVVATLVGIVIYKERLNVWNLIGICMVLGSIVLINIKFQKVFIERKGTDTLT